MHSSLDAEQELLRDSIRRFMRSEVAPLIAKHDVEKTFPFEILKELAQFGYIGGRLPEAEGGMGMDALTWAMLMEEAGYAWLSLRTMLNITNGSIHKIAAEGTPEQKQRFLLPLLACERRCFTAISEPGTGSNIAQIQTRADRQGEHYVLNGRKLWISNGAFADFGVVVARTFSPDCQGQLSTFLVEREVSPYDVRRVDTMVLRSTGTAELHFDNVKVPCANLIGEEGSALKRMLTGLDGARMNIAMGAVGAAQAALDLSSTTRARAPSSASRSAVSNWCKSSSSTWRCAWRPRVHWACALPPRSTRTRTRAWPAPSPSSTPPRPRTRWPAWRCRCMAHWATRPTTRSSASSATHAAAPSPRARRKSRR